SAKPRVFGQQAMVQHVSEEAKPIPDASVFVNGELVVKTGAEGAARVYVQGHAGDRFQLATTCPEGFRPTPGSAEQDVFVAPNIASSAPPQFVFRCESTARKATITVRAENGPDLPIRYLGREVGRTDARGAATVVLEAQ